MECDNKVEKQVTTQELKRFVILLHPFTFPFLPCRSAIVHAESIKNPIILPQRNDRWRPFCPSSASVTVILHPVAPSCCCHPGSPIAFLIRSFGSILHFLRCFWCPLASCLPMSFWWRQICRSLIKIELVWRRKGITYFFEGMSVMPGLRFNGCIWIWMMMNWSSEKKKKSRKAQNKSVYS